MKGNLFYDLAKAAMNAAGATVYVTGRSTRSAPAPGYGRFLAQARWSAMPGTIEDVAEEVTAAGGVGIPIRCDHGDPAQVQALVARVEREQGRLDLLVNNAWGGHETFTAASLDSPFWEQPLDHWESMFDHGVRNHVVACQAAAPLLVRQRGGLVVTTTFPSSTATPRPAPRLAPVTIAIRSWRVIEGS